MKTTIGRGRVAAGTKTAPAGRSGRPFFLVTMVLTSLLMQTDVYADVDPTGAPPVSGKPDPPRPLVLLNEPVVPAGDAGYLPAKGSTTPSGAYQLEIPIALPAGRAGMKPDLALVYSSRQP